MRSGDVAWRMEEVTKKPADLSETTTEKRTFR